MPAVRLILKPIGAERTQTNANDSYSCIPEGIIQNTRYYSGIMRVENVDGVS